MSKNLTRKGLAFGAIVALGTSLFAGAPAQAAAAITIAPTAGTGYTVLAKDTFTLKVYGNTDFTFASTTQLKYKVTKPSATASVAFENQGSGTPTATAQSTSTISYLTPSAVTADTAANTLKLTPTIGSTGTSSDYIVQPFIDLDASGDLNSADLAGNSVTVKFVKGAELTSVVTLDQVSASVDVTGTVKFTNTDFNYAQSTLANTQVLLKKNSSDFTSPTQTVTATLNDDKNGFEFTAASVSVAVSDVIAAKSQITGYDGDSTYSNSAVVYSTADAASTAVAQTTTISKSDNITGSSNDYKVRSGTKSFSYRVDFFKEAGKVNGIGAGKPVRITVTEDSTTIATNDVIRVNGKKLTGGAGTAQSAVLNTVTDATGGITVSVESDLGQLADKISIAVLATGSSLAAQTDAFTWEAAALTKLSRTNSQINSDKDTILKGSSVTLSYAIRDQFGKVWTKTGTSYRVKLVASGGSLTLTQNANFADGVASYTFTDNSTTAGTPDVTATLWEATTGDFTQNTAITNASDQVVSNFNVVTAAQAPATLTLLAAEDSTTAATKYSDADGAVTANLVPASSKSLKAIDLRSNENGSGIGNGNTTAKLGGSVKNADGSNASGVAVTLEVAGVYFSTDAAGSSYVANGSITLNTKVDGSYVVYALSTKGGAAAVKITSGSVTKTQNLKFAAAAATSGTTIVITAPSNSLPGKSVDVVVLLTDKNGAPVQTTTNGVERLSVALTGPGSNTAIAATTDADGKISFKLIFGANDLGSASVKVTYDADGDATVYAPVVVTKVIEVVSTLPSTTTARVSGSTKKMYVTVEGNTTGHYVYVKVAGKKFATLKGSTAKKTYVIAAPKGVHKVTVYNSGKLLATKTITVK